LDDIALAIEADINCRAVFYCAAASHPLFVLVQVADARKALDARFGFAFGNYQVVVNLIIPQVSAELQRKRICIGRNG
jgi:hypothetical protein